MFEEMDFVHMKIQEGESLKSVMWRWLEELSVRDCQMLTNSAFSSCMPRKTTFPSIPFS
jgi:hypothetical protein